MQFNSIGWKSVLQVRLLTPAHKGRKASAEFYGIRSSHPFGKECYLNIAQMVPSLTNTKKSLSRICAVTRPRLTQDSSHCSWRMIVPWPPTHKERLRHPALPGLMCWPNEIRGTKSTLSHIAVTPQYPPKIYGQWLSSTYIANIKC